MRNWVECGFKSHRLQYQTQRRGKLRVGTSVRTETYRWRHAGTLARSPNQDWEPVP